MSHQNQILVVGPQEDMTSALRDAIDGLSLQPHHCSLSDALATLDSADDISAAILTQVDLAQDQVEQAKKLLGQLDQLSIGLLTVSQPPVAEGLFASPPGQVIQSQAGESAEMLKGRLATLLELKPVLESLRKRSGQIENLSQPLTNYVNQVDEEMRLAARLQRDFLPKQLPEIDGMTFAAIYRPATWVSGDIYDVMRLDENHVGFYIADAVGHGMPAALLTMFIKRSIVTKRISRNSYELVAPEVVLQKLNGDLIEQNLSNFQFATACYGILNIHSLELKMASAGHPLPILIDEQGHSRELHVGGSLLGVFPDATYTTETFTLKRGEKLLTFSDGVEVAFVNEGPDQPLRFRQEFGNLSHYNIEAMCEKLLTIINAEEGSLHPRDDVTIVGIELA